MSTRQTMICPECWGEGIHKDVCSQPPLVQGWVSDPMTDPATLGDLAAMERRIMDALKREFP